LPLETSAAAMRQSPRAKAGPSDGVSGRCSTSGASSMAGSDALSFRPPAHRCATLRMADALIKANKRFDMLVIPGVRHGYGDRSAYFNWIRSDYFCRYLLGQAADSVDIVELNREKEQVGNKKPK